MAGGAEAAAEVLTAAAAVSRLGRATRGDAKEGDAVVGRARRRAALLRAIDERVDAEAERLRLALALPSQEDVSQPSASGVRVKSSGFTSTSVALWSALAAAAGHGQLLPVAGLADLGGILGRHPRRQARLTRSDRCRGPWHCVCQHASGPDEVAAQHLPSGPEMRHRCQQAANRTQTAACSWRPTCVPKRRCLRKPGARRFSGHWSCVLAGAQVLPLPRERSMAGTSLARTFRPLRPQRRPQATSSVFGFATLM